MICRATARARENLPDVPGVPSVGPGVRHAELLAEPDGEASRVVQEDPRIPVRSQGCRPHRRPVQHDRLHR